MKKIYVLGIMLILSVVPARAGIMNALAHVIDAATTVTFVDAFRKNDCKVAKQAFENHKAANKPISNDELNISHSYIRHEKGKVKRCIYEYFFQVKGAEKNLLSFLLPKDYEGFEVAMKRLKMTQLPQAVALDILHYDYDVIKYMFARNYMPINSGLLLASLERRDCVNDSRRYAIDLILAKGGKKLVNVPENGETPLERAANNGSSYQVCQLLKAGASVTKKACTNGETTSWSPGDGSCGRVELYNRCKEKGFTHAKEVWRKYATPCWQDD